MTIYDELGAEFAEAALTQLADNLGEAWAELSDQAKVDVQALLRDRGRLVVQAVSGRDVEAELRIVKATAASWAWVGSDKVRNALVETLEEIGQHLIRIVLAALVA